MKKKKKSGSNLRVLTLYQGVLIFPLKNTKTDGSEVKKAKQINKSNFGGIRHKEFIDVLFGGGVMRHRMKKNRIKLHKIGTYDISKISLSCFDDKRHILNDGINSLFS